LPVLVLIAALAYSFRPMPALVDFGTVERGAMRVTVDEEGRTRVRDVYIVSAPLAGQLMRIESEVGDHVTATETVVATIRPSDPSLLDVRSRAEAEAEVSGAEAARALSVAEVKRAKAQLEFAENELKRANALAKKGTISMRALDQAQLERKTSEAALAEARASLRVSQHRLATARARLIEPGAAGDSGKNCCVSIRAPVSGLILKKIHESQGVVAPGEPLLEIGDAGDLEVEVDLLSSDAVKVKAGDPVLIEQWGGGRTLNGRVRRIEPFGFTKVSALGIEEQRVNVIIRFTDPPEQLRPLGHGYRVEVRIVIWQAGDALKVPISALFRDKVGWAVFVEEDGRATKRTVTLGHVNTFEAQVASGLKAGERVVLHPSDQVVEGALVEAR
jgi:HlyD family secretion protein